jgi:hypothetical protein
MDVIVTCAPAVSCCQQVKVVTSDRAGAGTTAAVTISLYGAAGKSSGRQSLKAPAGSSKPCFQQGGTDTFVLGPMKDLGQLSRVVIGHNGMGPSPAWHLHHLAVTNLTSGQSWEFPSYQWIGTPGHSPGGGPVPVDVELRPGSAGDVQDTQYYDVGIFTGDEEDAGAGDDLVVTLVLLGSDGEAGPLYCTEEEAAAAAGGAGGSSSSRRRQPLFQRGGCDRFTMETKEEIGQLQKLKVGRVAALGVEFGREGQEGGAGGRQLAALLAWDTLEPAFPYAQWSNQPHHCPCNMLLALLPPTRRSWCLPQPATPPAAGSW